MVEAQLRIWEDQFPPALQTVPAKRSGTFNTEAGTSVSLSVYGTWTGRGSERASVPGYGLIAAVVPACVAGEGEQQYAFAMRAVGPAATIALGADPFAAFVRSSQTDFETVY